MTKICIIGGANIDILGRSDNPLRLHDSNPGTLSIRYGGVGRNIAEVLCALKQKVEFATCFSTDTFGKALYQDCIEKGMDCSKSVFVDNKKSSMYLAILDEKGELALGMSDMQILDEITKEDILHMVQDLKEEDILIVDSNFKESLIEVALNHAHCKRVADSVSVSKCMRLKPFLSEIDIFKPNQYEAEKLSGIKIVDENSAKEILQWFINEGVKEIVISMADKGVLLGTREGCYWYHHRNVNVADVTGGGDSFLGAYLAKRIQHVAPKEAIRYAIATAVTTIETGEIAYIEDNPKLLEQMQIEVVKL